MFGAALAMFCALPLVQAQPAGTLTAEELVPLLREGGYILYLRHAATDHSQSDRDLSDLRDCSQQRNLSAQGKQESETLKNALAALEIRIGEVLTSPYCRCVDTAEIAFGRYVIVDDLRATFFTNEEETRHLVDFLRTQLSAVPKAGTNTVLVGHTANLRDLTRVWPKPEGVAHVFRPLGDKGYEHLGRIEPTQWGPLAGID